MSEQNNSSKVVYTSPIPVVSVVASAILLVIVSAIVGVVMGVLAIIPIVNIFTTLIGSVIQAFLWIGTWIDIIRMLICRVKITEDGIVGKAKNFNSFSLKFDEIESISTYKRSLKITTNILTGKKKTLVYKINCIGKPHELIGLYNNEKAKAMGKGAKAQTAEEPVSDVTE